MAKTGEKNPLTTPKLNDNNGNEEVAEQSRKETRLDLLSGLQKEPGLEVEKDELYGDKGKILRSLKQKVEVEENVEYMGYKGKKVHINLPSVGNFEGFKFDYFVSNDLVWGDTFESKSELVDKSYSMKDVGGLLWAMNKYMQARGVETDGDVDYENDLKCWETGKVECAAGACLSDIAGFDDWYWLKDKIDGEENCRAEWLCVSDWCFFNVNLREGYNTARLFLRLS